MILAQLKEYFTITLVLVRYNLSVGTIFDIDELSNIPASVSLQYDNQGIVYPVVHLSKKNTPVEGNYIMNNQKLVQFSKAWNNGDKIVQNLFRL
jgi:hypothetical protein